jgi:3-oxoacyl-[acyl-carrier-protein] synthase III
MRAYIAGWGGAVPDGRLTNADLEARVDTTDEWIVERTGIRERRVADGGETTASLAITAGEAAIKSAGLHPDAIDLLIVATATPEQPIPHTGAFVSDGLGLHCGSFDMNVGCAGFIYGLVTGAALLQAGNLGYVLVIGAETLSRIIDPHDRGTCILFGDGAAAVVLAPTTDDGPGILGWDTGCDGSATGLLEIPAGGSRLPASAATIDAGLQYLKMQGPEVFRRAVRTVVESANIALDRAGVTVDDIDWFIPHQANLRIIEASASRLSLTRDQTIVNIDRYGNTSAASIPLAMSEAADAGRFRDGDLILMSGFGAGMAWGSAVVRWGRT